jgi:hypothetical protein
VKNTDVWSPHATGVTPAAVETFGAQRSATRAVLLGIHAGTRLSKGGPGTADDRASMGWVGRVPIELAEKILLLADVEISELLHNSLPAKPTRDDFTVD